MMTSLDIRGSQPVIFQQVAGATALRLGFSSEAEALAFVFAFGGHVRSLGLGSAASWDTKGLAEFRHCVCRDDRRLFFSPGCVSCPSLRWA
jgi:hypothetical protein